MWFWERRKGTSRFTSLPWRKQRHKKRQIKRKKERKKTLFVLTFLKIIANEREHQNTLFRKLSKHETRATLNSPVLRATFNISINSWTQIYSSEEPEGKKKRKKKKRKEKKKRRRKNSQSENEDERKLRNTKKNTQTITNWISQKHNKSRKKNKNK